jgi:small-conductance mechanosensitive channel
LSLANSLRRLVIGIVILVAVSFTIVFLFDQFVAVPVRLPDLLRETTRTFIIVLFGLLVVFFIRRSKSVIAKRIGPTPATVFQFFMVLAAIIVMVFAVLNAFQVPATTLLLGGGIVSITIGLIVSTFVGNILAGTLVFMTHPFRIGDTVIINNVPGRIEEISAMVTRIRNDVGGLTVVPNTAIAQGSVIITKIPISATKEGVKVSRLPYLEGDRVYTTYLSSEGVVKEVDSFQTRILLDSGKEITFLNTSVLTGSVAVARIAPEKSAKKDEKTGDTL